MHGLSEGIMANETLPAEALLSFIRDRRSCRAFADTPVSEEDVQAILDCALAAPSAGGFQTWQFTAVTDKAKIEKLYKAVGKAIGNGDYNMYKPAAIIITSNDKSSKFCAIDNACAMENIYLACRALGLGCVWINQVCDCFDDAGVRAVLTEFGVPENHGVYGTAAFGYAAEEPGAKEIKGKAVVVG